MGLDTLSIESIEKDVLFGWRWSPQYIVLLSFLVDTESVVLVLLAVQNV